MFSLRSFFLGVSILAEYSEFYNYGNSVILPDAHQIYMATDENLYPNTVFRLQYCYICKTYIRGVGSTVIFSDNTELDVARRRMEEFIKLITKL